MAGQSSSGMVQLAGGVEHIERIKPQPAPAPAPCPPGQAPVPCPPAESNAPMGPPVAVHEPAPGQRTVIEVVPNQPLIFDFNPLDLKATQHDGSVVLTFPDGAQLELHDIVGPCGVQPTPFQLPDGTVITPGDLLQAFHFEVLGPCGLVAPTPIVPHHHEVPNTGFYVSPFEVGVIGPGILGLGPLEPTGFGYGAEFLKGTGGSHFAPPGPPGPPPPPPPPPPGTELLVQDDDVQFPNINDTTITSNYLTIDTHGGQPIVVSTPPAWIADVAPFGGATTGVPTNNTPVTVSGAIGDLTIQHDGTYSYVLNPSFVANTLPELGTDFVSQTFNANFSAYNFEVKDYFTITTENGVDPTPAGNKELEFYTTGADVYPTSVVSVPAYVPGTSGMAASSGTSEILLTYTDALDPAHSFQTLATVDNTGAATFAVANTDIPIQPNDPALVTLQYVSGADVTVNSIQVAGETLNFTTPDTLSASAQALTAVVNPILNGLGDPGDISGSSTPTQNPSHDYVNAATATLVAADLTPYTDAASGQSGNFGFVYDNNTVATTTVMSAVGSGATADVLAIDGIQTGATSITGSDTPGSTNTIEWDSSSLISNAALPGLTIDGGSGQGINTLQVESAGSQDLVFNGTDFFTGNSQNLTSGVNIQNIEAIDLTDTRGNPVLGNSVALSVQDVINLAQNEPAGLEAATGAVSLGYWAMPPTTP